MKKILFFALLICTAMVCMQPLLIASQQNHPLIVQIQATAINNDVATPVTVENYTISCVSWRVEAVTTAPRSMTILQASYKVWLPQFYRCSDLMDVNFDNGLQKPDIHSWYFTADTQGGLQSFS